MDKRFRIEGHRGEAGFRELLKWQMSGNRAPLAKTGGEPQPSPAARNGFTART